jgi:hypothetical protein
MSWLIRLLVVCCCAVAFASHAPAVTFADPVDGSYSLELAVDDPSVAVGDSFTIRAVIDRGTNPPYQAAQWRFRFDPEFMSIEELRTADGAPDVCSFTSSDSNSVLLGCIDLSGPNLDFSGTAFEVIATCESDAAIELNLDGNDASFVAGGNLDDPYQPVHLHGATVNCGSGGPTVVVPTATPDPGVPSPGPITSPQPGGTATPAPDGTAGAGSPSPVSGTPDPDGTPGPDGGATLEPTQAAQTATAEASATEEAEDPDSGEDSDDSDSSTWVWVLLAAVAVLLAAGGGLFYYLRARRTP